MGRYMCITWSKLPILISTIFITACGAGSSGGDAGSTNTSSPYFQLPVAVDSFQPLVGSGNAFPIFDVFTRDLNNDGVDEVLIAGRKTQPASAANWQDFNMQIYGWNSGSFANETTNWFAGSDNVIVGTEPAVWFGDFNGDSNIDVVIGAGTDMNELKADTLVFRNNGNGTFTKVVVNSATNWSHDIVVHDINSDGRDDILISDYGNKTSLYLGNADGSFTAHISDNYGYGASGVSIGDYIPGGELEVALTDNGVDAINDTRLMVWSVPDPAVPGLLTLTDSGKVMPGSLYTQAESDASIYSAHAIRNRGMDFDADTDLDLVVFERLDTVSGVQFLENDGNGNFTDVTSTKRLNYFSDNGGVNYQPVIQDFNGDGLDDIFLSGNDFDGEDNATQVLLQSSDGKFVGSYGSVFTAFTNTIQAKESESGLYVFPTGMNQHLIKGPNNEDYLMSHVYWMDAASTGRITTYIAKLGTLVIQSPQTASELLAVAWPYPQQ